MEEDIDLNLQRAIAEIKRRDENQKDSEQLVAVCIHGIVGFSIFHLFAIVASSWMWEVITSGTNRVEVVANWLAITLIAMYIWMSWYISTIDPISDDASEGFRIIWKIIKGSIAGAKKTANDEL